MIVDGGCDSKCAWLKWAEEKEHADRSERCCDGVMMDVMIVLN